MLKKILAFTTAFLLSATVLTACTTNSTTANPPSSKSTAVSVDDAPSYETATNSSKAKVTIEGTKFLVDGKELWINGVNTPWDKWNDFGGEFNEEFWDSHFAELSANGVNASRVWVNCASTVVVRLKTTGEVKEVNEKHWEDVDKLFAIAEKYGIYLMPTILSFDHFKEGTSGYQLWRALVADDNNVQSYIDQYVIPFAKRYGENPYLLGIDLMNEPDWVVENAECGQISWDVMASFFAKCTSAIHENSTANVTVGLGMVKYNSDKFEGNIMSDENLKKLGGDNACLDFYSPHYYDWQRGYMGYPFETSPEGFGLDGTKPVVLGECPANAGGGDLAKQYEGAYNNGWNGVMAWTSNGVDNCGSLEDIKPAVESIVNIAEEKVYPLGKN